jgi:hypothetical protein
LRSASRASDANVVSLFAGDQTSTTSEGETLAKLSPLPSVLNFFYRVLSQVDARSKGKAKQDVSGEGFVKQLLGVSRPYTEAACRLLDRYH